MSLLLFAIFLCVIYTVKYYWTHWDLFFYGWHIPGPLALPLIGNLIDFRNWKTPLFKDYLSYYKEFGGIYRVWAGHNLLVVVTDPTLADTLLNMKAEIFPKPVFFDFFNVRFGQSIFFQGEYAAWKAHRKILNRVFQTGALAKLTNCLHNKILSHTDDLRMDQSEHSLHKMFYSWQCEVISHAVFGLKFKPTEIDLICYVNKRFLKLFSESIKSVSYRIQPLQRFTAFQTRKTTLETVAHLGMVHFYTTGLEARRDPSLTDVKLADLGAELGPTFLDELGIFNVAGMETLTTAFSATLFLLSLHREAQDKTYEELIAILGSDYRKEPTLGELEDLKYLDMVIKETLRLYPPGYVAARRATENIQIGDYTIPKDASILINVSGLHRDPSHFPSPDLFLPERFSPLQASQRPRHCFIPFGSGPRKCIGQKFALLHLKLALSVLVRRFEFLPSDRYPSRRMDECDTVFRFVIEFRDGCYVKVRPRELTPSAT